MRSAGREDSPLQGPGVSLGHAHRRAHVRALDGVDVPPAAHDAGAARLHGDAGGDGAHAARLCHDDRDSDRGEDLQPRLSTCRHRHRRLVHRVGGVLDEPLHARDEPARRHLGDHDAGGRLLVPLRSALDGRAHVDSAPRDGRRDGAQLTLPSDRRLNRPRRRCDAPLSLHGAGARIARRARDRHQPRSGHAAGWRSGSAIWMANRRKTLRSR